MLLFASFVIPVTRLVHFCPRTARSSIHLPAVIRYLDSDSICAFTLSVLLLCPRSYFVCTSALSVSSLCPQSHLRRQIEGEHGIVVDDMYLLRHIPGDDALKLSAGTLAFASGTETSVDPFSILHNLSEDSRLESNSSPPCSTRVLPFEIKVVDSGKRVRSAHWSVSYGDIL